MVTMNDEANLAESLWKKRFNLNGKLKNKGQRGVEKEPVFLG